MSSSSQVISSPSSSKATLFPVPSKAEDKKRTFSDHVELAGETINCTVCLGRMLGKILGCNEGHCICDTCFEALPVPKRCGTCRARFSIPPSRQRALEEILSRFNLPCEHGCGFLGQAPALMEHQPLCLRAPVACPDLGCNRLIQADQLAQHFLDSHLDSFCDLGNPVHLYKKSLEEVGSVQWVFNLGVEKGILYLLMDWSKALMERRLLQFRVFHFAEKWTFNVAIAGSLRFSGETERWGAYTGQDLGKGFIWTREAFDVACAGGERVPLALSLLP